VSCALGAHRAGPALTFRAESHIVCAVNPPFAPGVRGALTTEAEKPDMPEDRRASQSDRDLTPVVGAETDVARIGHAGPPPPHEMTADEDVDVVDWNRIAATEEFKALLRAKARFLVPATLFFVVYYFALPVLVGFWPELMDTRVFGSVNLAYLFALSQFFMAWALAWIYLRKAAKFDDQAHRIISRLDRNTEGR
jgi:uncharacterized membrane protein (DUF485 family)